MVKDSLNTENDPGVDSKQFDEEHFVTQQLPAKRDENFEEIETTKSFTTCLKELLVRIFCPRCFVYPFLAVVVVVVTAVLIVQVTTKDDTRITPIIIKDYADVNATSAPVTPTNAPVVSPLPSYLPSST